MKVLATVIIACLLSILIFPYIRQPESRKLLISSAAYISTSGNSDVDPDFPIVRVSYPEDHNFGIVVFSDDKEEAQVIRTAPTCEKEDEETLKEGIQMLTVSLLMLKVLQNLRN